MAYFVLGGTDGTDAGLSGSDNTHTVPATSHIDVIVWNHSDTTVDVHLEFAATQTESAWVLSAVEHQAIHELNQYRDVAINANTVEIRQLQAKAAFPLRLTNTGSTAVNWLDVSACSVFESGHGTRVFNGQRVYVIPYNIVSFA